MRNFVAYAMVFLFAIRTCVASGLVAIVIELINNTRNLRSSSSKKIKAAENRTTGRNTSSGRSGCGDDILNITVPSPIPVVSPSVGVPPPPKCLPTEALTRLPDEAESEQRLPPQAAFWEHFSHDDAQSMLYRHYGEDHDLVMSDKPFPTYIVSDEATKGFDGITVLPTINNKEDGDVFVEEVEQYKDEIALAKDLEKDSKVNKCKNHHKTI